MTNHPEEAPAIGGQFEVIVEYSGSYRADWKPNSDRSRSSNGPTWMMPATQIITSMAPTSSSTSLTQRVTPSNEFVRQCQSEPA